MVSNPSGGSIYNNFIQSGQFTIKLTDRKSPSFLSLASSHLIRIPSLVKKLIRRISAIVSAGETGDAPRGRMSAYGT
jgi:hypothetical protein